MDRSKDKWNQNCFHNRNHAIIKSIDSNEVKSYIHVPISNMHNFPIPMHYECVLFFINLIHTKIEMIGVMPKYFYRIQAKLLNDQNFQ